MYLAHRTRPDLALAVQFIAKFQHDRAPKHWKALKHMVWYVNSTAKYGLQVSKGGSRQEIEVYCDTDWRA